MHCNKNDINSIKLCLSFSQGLEIQVGYFFKCSSFWGTASPRPLPGLCPRTPLGDFRPQTPICPPPTPPSRSAPASCHVLILGSKMIPKGFDFAFSFMKNFGHPLYQGRRYKNFGEFIETRRRERDVGVDWVGNGDGYTLPID